MVHEDKVTTIDIAEIDALASADVRADVVIASLSGLSRSRIKRLAASGKILINGVALVDMDKKLACGTLMIYDEEEHHIPPAADVDFGILYEDDDLLVINKPAGVTVHPGAGTHTDTIVNGLIYRYGQLSDVGGVMRPGIVHRLDKDTSGVMVVAKNDFTHVELSKQLSAREMSRKYIAITAHTPPKKSGRIITNIERSRNDHERMCVSRNGKESITNYTLKEKWQFASMVECSLETGRTHQIRVHMQHIGCGVIGDKKYKEKYRRSIPLEVWDKFNAFNRQALHAYEIKLQHPRSLNELVVGCELPEDMMELIAYCKNCHPA